MTAEGDGPARRVTEPLIEAAAEGAVVAAETAEYMLEGLRQNRRFRAERAPAAGARAPRPGPSDAADERAARREKRRRAGAGAVRGERAGAPPPRQVDPGGIIESLADIAADLLDAGAELAQDVAGYVGERGRDADEPHVLDLEAVPGETDEVEFKITNTGPTALREVELTTTELVSGPRRIIDAVAFEPSPIKRIRPGGSEIVTIAIGVPADAEPGIYRGIVDADPGGAWAVLELQVASEDRGLAAVEAAAAAEEVEPDPPEAA